MRKRGFDRVEIEVFVALAEAGGVPAVARALGLHHSTVLRVLGSLEARAGVPLFDRLPGRYRPTAAGQALVDSARTLRDTFARFEMHLSQVGQLQSGPVRLTTSDGLAAQLVPRWLASFARRCPDVEVQLIVSNTLADLRDRDVDVALRPTRQPAGYLVGRRAGTLSYSLYASPEYLASRGYDGSLAPQLAGHDLCGYASVLSFFSTAEWLASHARAARVAGRFDNLVAMREAARAGLGIAALPCFMAEADPTLVRLVTPPASMRTGLWVLTHPQLRRVPRVRLLTAHLTGCIVDDARLLEPAIG